MDRTKDITKPNPIGLIIPILFTDGYTYCPITRKRFHFNKSIPPAFKSPEKAGEWLKAHAVLRKQKYTIFNSLIWLVYEMPGFLRIFLDVRTTIIIGTLIGIGLLLYVQPADPKLSITMKIGAVVLGIRLIVDTIAFAKTYKEPPKFL